MTEVDVPAASDSKVHGAIMGPTWVLSAPDGPHVGPMSFAIRIYIYTFIKKKAGFRFFITLWGGWCTKHGSSLAPEDPSSFACKR